MIRNANTKNNGAAARTKKRGYDVIGFNCQAARVMPSMYSSRPEAQTMNTAQACQRWTWHSYKQILLWGTLDEKRWTRKCDDCFRKEKSWKTKRKKQNDGEQPSPLSKWPTCRLADEHERRNKHERDHRL